MITRPIVTPSSEHDARITVDAVVSMCAQKPQTATTLCRGLVRKWHIIKPAFDEARCKGLIEATEDGWVATSLDSSFPTSGKI